MARSEIGRTGARFGEPLPRHTPDPEHPHGPPDDAAPGPGSAHGESPAGESPADEPPAGEDLVGVTGARFGGHSAKRTRRSRRERAAESAATESAATESAATESAATESAATGPAATGRAATEPAAIEYAATERAETAGPARAARHPAGTPPDTAAGAAARDTAWDTDPDTWDAIRVTAPLTAVGPDPDPDPDPGRAASTPVRPYVLTGGRTRVRAELRLETLVSARPVPGAGPVDTAEKAAVLGICARPRAVSEVAALVKVPLGVARVLIDDLATEGRVTVHGVSSADDGPGLALLERVLSGLRRL